MVWAGICATEMASLAFIKENVEIISATYQQEVLRDVLDSWTTQHFCANNLRFNRTEFLCIRTAQHFPSAKSSFQASGEASFVRGHVVTVFAIHVISATAPSNEEITSYVAKYSTSKPFMIM
ncbi:hypothetical protein KIN20_000656 [Parelaphostrongylus tenuis]|uniref:Uncharacterized protein n=1 Tax=Parelaphostrongylus tenuis TaxID=148309 RepID=A0AAD5LVU1_PARTN|nr:hypothetical protein KIN20_000656 [Parelaphostrongylus tenuis]